MTQNPPPAGSDLPIQLLTSRGLLPNSQAALKAALSIATLDGVGGFLAVRIPEGLAKPFDFTFTVGMADLVVRHPRMN